MERNVKGVKPAEESVGNVSARVRKIQISATKLMPMIAADVPGCVSLGQGIPSFAPSAHIIDAVCERMRLDPAVTRYSLQPGMLELRHAIADSLAATKGVAYDPVTEIAVTVGAMEALLMAILTVVDRGDEVILLPPCYPSHIEQVLLAEGVPVFAPLSPDWTLDVDAVKRAITPRTKAIVINSPANPTGSVFSEESLREVAQLALKRDLTVIVDETYDSLAFDGITPFSLLRVPELRGSVICVNSFSKKYALTGWRVGYAAAPARLMGQMLKVHDCTAICAPAPSQLAALAALTGPQDAAAEYAAILEKRRDLTCEHLDALSGYFSYVRPAGAFYVMARYRNLDLPSMEVATRLIREAKVITIPGGSFGPGGEFHLRLSFGGTEDEINTAFDRIGEWFGRL